MRGLRTASVRRGTGAFGALAVGLLLGWLGLSPGLLAAQGPGRLEMERRVQARFAALVVQQLGLSSQEGEELGRILRSFQEERSELRRREMAVRRSLVAQGVLDPRRAPPLLDEPRAAELVEEMKAIREAEFDLQQREQEALLGVLEPPQLVRFLALREVLIRRIGRLREGRPGAAPRGSGGGGGGLPELLPER